MDQSSPLVGRHDRNAFSRLAFPRRWRGLHPATWVAGGTVAGALIVVNLVGYDRPEKNLGAWWHGWPLWYAYRWREWSRSGPATAWFEMTGLGRFRPYALGANVLIAAVIVVATFYAVERLCSTLAVPQRFSLKFLLAVTAWIGWLLALGSPQSDAWAFRLHAAATVCVCLATALVWFAALDAMEFVWKRVTERR